MRNFKVLILDDDYEWINCLKSIIQDAGFETVTTQYAGEAIKLGQTDKNIKFALVDEILYEPPIPRPEQNHLGVLQQPQGQGVMREIRKHRHDIQFIVVTSAPYDRSKQRKDLVQFNIETNHLRRSVPGIIDLLHKCELDKYAEQHHRDQTCKWLYSLLEKPIYAAAKTRDTFATVTLGLGFMDDIYLKTLEQMKRRKTNYTSIRPLLNMDNHSNSRIVNDFVQAAQKKCIFIEPISTNQHIDIKVSPQQLQILELLAKKSVLGQPVNIAPSEYQYVSRGELLGAVDPDTFDKLLSQDMLYSNEGYHRHSYGASIFDTTDEIQQVATRNLASQISYLKKKLATADVAPLDHLFKREQGIQRPLFELDITLFRLPKIKESNRVKKRKW